MTAGDFLGTREHLKSNYLYRMLAAVLIIYGNSKEEAMYPVYTVDEAGQKLYAAQNRYTLRFAPGQLPPVNAFWSLTTRGNAGDLMSSYISTDRIGDVAVLQCAGRMVRAHGLSLLRDAVISLSQLRVIVLDLSEVEVLDAGGLGLLVSLHNWACENGIQLKLVNPSKLVREMLELTGLASVLHISSVDDLIEIFCNSDKAIENMHRAVASSAFSKAS